MENNTPLLRPALALLGLFTLLTGVVYPLAVWGIGQTLFPRQANGSLIEANGRIVGSELIAQSFTGPEWFWPRPSAVDFDSSESGGSNFATTNPELLQEVEERVDALRSASPETTEIRIPVDLVTSSGSGLDPHLTPASALFQAPRVAAVRGLEIDTVKQLIAAHTENRTLGFLGEPRVNVLRLNLSLKEYSSGE